MPTNSSKQIVKKTSGKMGKLLGAANMILSVIPDTVEIVGKITDKTAPIVDKHLDRKHQYKKSLVAIPNLLDVDIQQAREHLEGLGLQVIVVLAKPNKKYIKADAGEVVAMVPRSGKVQPGSLIKLYYVDELVIEASKKEVALPDVTGLVLTEAQELLENLGYRVAAFPIKPRSQYASITVNQVISMSPNPRLNLTPVKKGNLIKLFYLDAATKQASRILRKSEQDKKAANAQTLKKNLNKIQEMLPGKKK